MATAIRAIDLCCGAGGWAAAARGLPIEWLAVADCAEDCLETWQVNHAQDHPKCRCLAVDLSTQAGIDAVGEVAGGVALIVGGIPCEKISPHRGNRPVSKREWTNFYGLLDNCLNLIRLLRPRWWCLEDVIQIEAYLPLPLWHGRKVPYVRIDASRFGPQKRLRTFLGEFPVPQADAPETLASCLLPGPHLTFAGADGYKQNPTNRSRVGKDFIRLLDPAEPSPTITSSFNLRGGRQRRTWIVEDGQGRRRLLSWQEAALVQGFPRDYLFVSGVTRACEMIGQAIPIQVGRAILQAIIEAADRRRETRSDE